MILKKLLVVALSAVLCILEVGCSSKNTSSGEKKMKSYMLVQKI